MRTTTEYGLRVAEECLPRGINVRPRLPVASHGTCTHRPICDEYDEYEYPILPNPTSLVRLFVLAQRTDQLAAQHTNWTQHANINVICSPTETLSSDPGASPIIRVTFFSFGAARRSVFGHEIMRPRSER